MVRWFISFIFLLLVPHVATAEVSASLNQYITPIGESVQLTVTAKGSVDGEPDISVLRKDFDILSQSQSSNFSMVNGSFNRSKTWVYDLMPKREGVIQVPAIDVGNEKTQALMLRVLNGSQQSHTGQPRDVWLETMLDEGEVYVQAQAILTVKLFRRVNLSQAELSEPDIQGAIVQRLGDDKNYETVADGRRVIVTERKYALFPQRSGQLDIPSIQFDGVVSNSRSVFAMGRSMRLRSQPLSLNVLTQPDTWSKHDPWLPAQALVLQEIIPDGKVPDYQVGEPFTRTLELKAQGLTSAQLQPLLAGAAIDGFKLYPDQPELSQEVNNQGLVGIRREKVAMIPTKAGTLHLPEVRVKWWNTETNEVRSAVIAARDIEVLPAANSNVAAVTPTQAALPAEQPKQPQSQTIETTKELIATQQMKASQGLFWKWFALIFAASWFITMLLWWRVSKKAVAKQGTKPDVMQTFKEVEQQLKKACNMGDTKQVLDIIPKWGAALYQDDSIQTLLQLKGKSDALDEALRALQAVRYAKGDSSNWSCEGLMQALRALKEKEKQKGENRAELRSLYDK